MNPFFPVEYSTLSGSHLLQLIKLQYNFPSGTSISYIKRGFNDTYLINDNNHKYILRVYKHGWKNLAQIETEIKLLIHLHENGVSVSHSISDKQLQFIQTIIAPEGERYAVLFSFADGQQLKKLNSEQAFLLGKQTGKIHRLTQNNYFGETAFVYDFKTQFNNVINTLQPLLTEYTEQYEYLLSLQEIFLTVWKNSNEKEIAQGVCHGDLQAENFHINADNEITFFDFDFLGTGCLIYDIGVFSWYDHKNKPKEIMDSFLKGYQTERILTETETQLLPYFSTLRALFQLNLFCSISNGSSLPLWPTEQAASFVWKIKKWQEARRTY
jgi:Ser/Thr protein kinase RdoA (MazF antagonist)